MPASLQLALLIAILLPAGKLVAAISTRFGIPAILGELLVGVLAGPGCLDMLHMKLFSGTSAADAFLLVAQIGGLVLMFIAGLETDIDRMKEASVTAFLVALSGVIWPFFLGAGVAHFFGLSWSTSCFLGGALTATSVSISARTLMDAGRMTSPEASVILGAAVIDDVMGLFVLAFLAASCTTATAGGFGLAPSLAWWLQHHSEFGASHPIVVQMTLIAVCVTAFFVVSFFVAQRGADPFMRLVRKLDVNEAVTSCVLALVLIYAVSAEWLGSVAGITGAYLLGYVFAGAKLKPLIERTFSSLGHGLLIPLFFVSIGLSSNFRALGGHWLLLSAIFIVAVVSKLLGCGSAALVMGMGRVRSFRVGCGMISRGEVGLIVTAMGASTGIFREPEVAVMVTVVLLTTLFTPLIMRGAFLIKDPSEESDDQGTPESSSDRAGSGSVHAFSALAPPVSD
jgi:Kef-type K+ transport system membrane component KefB